MKRWFAWAIAALIAALGHSSAWAQNASVSAIGASDIGTVVSASSGATTFTLDPATGKVTTTSGSGVRLSSGSARALVTIYCGNQPACASQDTLITVTASGTPTGRAGKLTNFTPSTSGTTTTITSTISTGSTLKFTIDQFGRKTSTDFWIGFDYPINGDNSSGASGAAASGFTVTSSRLSGSGAVSLASTSRATVLRTITMSKTADLAFGRIVRPRSGSGTATLAPATGAVSVSGSGMAVLGTGRSAAAFAVTGEGGQSISFSVPSTFNLTNGTNSLTVTTNPSASGAQVLSGAIGAAGTFTLKLGGTLPITSTTPSGTYTGSVSVTVAYN